MDKEFSDRARKVMALANQEAQRFNHDYIGTEHVLLGLVKEGSGVGANVLKNLGADFRRVRIEVEKLVKPGQDTILGRLPQTDGVKRLIQQAIDAADMMGHGYVGTEHLLYALNEDRGTDEIVHTVMANLGIDLEMVALETEDLLEVSEGVLVSSPRVVTIDTERYLPIPRGSMSLPQVLKLYGIDSRPKKGDNKCLEVYGVVGGSDEVLGSLRANGDSFRPVVKYDKNNPNQIRQAVAYREVLKNIGMPYTEVPSRASLLRYLREPVRDVLSLADLVEGKSQ